MKRTLLALFFIPCLMFAQNTAPAEARSTLPNGVRILATLKSKLDTSKLEPGDIVQLEVAANLRGPDGKVALPRGAKLRGRVTDAAAKTKEQPNARLAILVESAEWQGGKMPLHAVFDADQPRQARATRTTARRNDGYRPSNTVSVGDSLANCMSGNSPPPQEEAFEMDASSPLDMPRSSFEDVRFRTEAGLGMVAESSTRNIVLEPDTEVRLLQVKQ